MNTLSVSAVFDALESGINRIEKLPVVGRHRHQQFFGVGIGGHVRRILRCFGIAFAAVSFSSLNLARSEEHTSELQSLAYLVCRLLLEKKKRNMSHSTVVVLHAVSYHHDTNRF